MYHDCSRHDSLPSFACTFMKYTCVIHVYFIKELTHMMNCVLLLCVFGRFLSIMYLLGLELGAEKCLHQVSLNCVSGRFLGVHLSCTRTTIIEGVE